MAERERKKNRELICLYRCSSSCFVFHRVQVWVSNILREKFGRLHRPLGGGCKGPEFMLDGCGMPMLEPPELPPLTMGGAGLPPEVGVFPPPCPDRFVGNEGRSSSLSYAK